MKKVTVELFTKKRMSWFTGKPEGLWMPAWSCSDGEVADQLQEVAQCHPHFADDTETEAITRIVQAPKSYGIEAEIEVIEHRKHKNRALK